MFGGAEPLASLGEIPLDGFVRVGAVFGHIFVVEAKPGGIFSRLDGC